MRRRKRWRRPGSPPRVWGILQKHGGGGRGLMDHPHVCGEYDITPLTAATYAGSPPRVWGIQRVPQGVEGRLGITPTCVGNTPPVSGSAGFPRDHPHVCGEYGPGRLLRPEAEGSPPRVWGIQPNPHEPRRHRRITPTCVGNTPCRAPCPSGSEDHPHVCGEYVVPVLGGHGPVGSPPRVWGIPHAVHVEGVETGITPTCVGNTPCRAPCPSGSEDHPHVCGEYVVPVLGGHGPVGSPPRVWGIL